MVGEMITAAYLALAKHDPDKGLPSTIIFTYCRNRLLRILKREKEFYNYHTSLPPNIHSIKQLSPCERNILEESLSILEKSKLSARTKEVVRTQLEYPCDTHQEIGERLGISKQAINLHINSAKEFFKNNKVQLEF